MVQVRRTDHESPTIAAHTYRHVSGGNVGGCAAGGHRRLLAPPPEKLTEFDNVANFAASRHFLFFSSFVFGGGKLEGKERKILEFVSGGLVFVLRNELKENKRRGV